MSKGIYTGLIALALSLIVGFSVYDWLLPRMPEFLASWIAIVVGLIAGNLFDYRESK